MAFDDLGYDPSQDSEESSPQPQQPKQGFDSFGGVFANMGDSDTSQAIAQLKGQMVGGVYVGPHVLQYIGAAMQNMKANTEQAQAMAKLEEAIQSGGGTEALLGYAKATKNKKLAEGILLKLASKKEKQAAASMNMQMLAQAFPGLTQQEIAMASMADKPEDAVKLIMEARKPITTPAGAVLAPDGKGGYMNAPGSLESMKQFIQTQEGVKAGNDIEWIASPDGTMRAVTRKQLVDQANPQGAAQAPASVKIPEQYQNLVQSAAQANGIPSNLLAAVIQRESGWDPTAKGTSGEIGLGQLMPKTAEQLGVTDRSDPVQNANGAAKYLNQMLTRYEGNLEKALQAYNGGPGNVDKGTVSEAAKKYAKETMAALGASKESSGIVGYDPGKADPVKKAAGEQEVKLIGERTTELNKAKGDLLGLYRAKKLLADPKVMAGFYGAEGITRAVQTANQVFGTNIAPDSVKNTSELLNVLTDLSLNEMRKIAPVTDTDRQFIENRYGSIERNPEALRALVNKQIETYENAVKDHNSVITKRFPENTSFMVNLPKIQASGEVDRREAKPDPNSTYSKYPNIFDKRVSGTPRETPEQKAARLRKQYNLGN
jgi:hypothetical protein